VSSISKHLITSQLIPLRYLLNAAKQHYLARITLDEAHEYAADMAKPSPFREAMLFIVNLIRLGTPITLLTGTMPPSAWSSYLRYLGFDAHATGFIKVRKDSLRHDLRMLVLSPQARSNMHQAAVGAVKHLVSSKLMGMDFSKWTGMVFATSKNDVETVCALLKKEFPGPGYTHYHSGHKEGLSSWNVNENQIIVTTTALGPGIQNNTTRFVLVLGHLYGATNIVQAGSRAGRDGKGGLLLMLPEKGSSPHCPEPSIDIQGIAAYLRTVGKRQCRRLPLEEHLDGRPIDESKPCVQAKCDFCDPAFVEPLNTSILFHIREVKSRLNQSPASCMLNPTQNQATSSGPSASSRKRMFMPSAAKGLDSSSSSQQPPLINHSSRPHDKIALTTPPLLDRTLTSIGEDLFDTPTPMSKHLPTLEVISTSISDRTHPQSMVGHSNAPQISQGQLRPVRNTRQRSHSLEEELLQPPKRLRGAGQAMEVSQQENLLLFDRLDTDTGQQPSVSPVWGSPVCQPELILSNSQPRLQGALEATQSEAPSSQSTYYHDPLPNSLYASIHVPEGLYVPLSQRDNPRSDRPATTLSRNGSALRIQSNTHVHRRTASDTAAFINNSTSRAPSLHSQVLARSTSPFSYSSPDQLRDTPCHVPNHLQGHINPTQVSVHSAGSQNLERRVSALPSHVGRSLHGRSASASSAVPQGTFPWSQTPKGGYGSPRAPLSQHILGMGKKAAVRIMPAMKHSSKVPYFDEHAAKDEAMIRDIINSHSLLSSMASGCCLACIIDHHVFVQLDIPTQWVHEDLQDCIKHHRAPNGYRAPWNFRQWKKDVEVDTSKIDVCFQCRLPTTSNDPAPAPFHHSNQSGKSLCPTGTLLPSMWWRAWHHVQNTSVTIAGSIQTPIPLECSGDVVVFGEWCMTLAVNSCYTNGMYLYRSWLHHIVVEAERISLSM
jgi:hypothetical protein